MKKLDEYFDFWKIGWDTVIRYALMTAFGALATLGYNFDSLVEPVIGLVLAIFTILWYSWKGKPKEEDK